MSITDISGQEIRDGLFEVKKDVKTPNETVRVVFAPTRIDESNLREACQIYGRLNPEDFNTVVIVESCPSDQWKKLPMPSHKFFKTPMGDVPVNDKLRNELCDEDDDFFIDDDAYHEGMSLYDQLMMLQNISDDFSVVSIQITDEHPAIVKELAYVLEEVLASQMALVVFCCNLQAKKIEEFEKVKEFLNEKNISGLLNHMNNGESDIQGTGSFVAGVLLAEAWGLKIDFLSNADTDHTNSNLLTAIAENTPHQIFG